MEALSTYVGNPNVNATHEDFDEHLLSCTRLTTSCIILSFIVCARITEEMVALISIPTVQSGVPGHACSAEAHVEMFAIFHHV